MPVSIVNSVIQQVRLRWDLHLGLLLVPYLGWVGVHISPGKDNSQTESSSSLRMCPVPVTRKDLPVFFMSSQLAFWERGGSQQAGRKIISHCGVHIHSEFSCSTRTVFNVPGVGFLSLSLHMGI